VKTLVEHIAAALWQRPAVRRYVRWMRAPRTWWARWHFYVGLASAFGLLCLLFIVLDR
jgi:hypothetical protein